MKFVYKIFCSLALACVLAVLGFSTFAICMIFSALALVWVLLIGYEKILKYETAIDLSIENRIRDAVEAHVSALARSRMTMVREDQYGTVVSLKWQKECSYFFDSVIAENFDKAMLERYQAYDSDKKAELNAIIEERVLKEQRAKESLISYDESLNPYEYESFCAYLLVRADWHARATSGSGDQGVDVIASRNGKTLVIQCKKYSRPVGNKAVQEVIAARQYMNAEYAAVVTNNSYTKSANELAARTGVLLLHHTDLLHIDSALHVPIEGV